MSRPVSGSRRGWGSWRWLALALLLVPLVEVYVLVQVGQQIGAPATIASLVAVSVLGAWLVRREGTAAWRAFQQALAAGRAPALEVADGALVLVGATLLLTPGFVTDLVGVLLLAPPTRVPLRRLLLRWGAARALARLGRSRGRPHHDGRVVPGVVLDAPVVDDGDGRGRRGGPGG